MRRNMLTISKMTPIPILLTRTNSGWNPLALTYDLGRKQTADRLQCLGTTPYD